MIRPRPVHLVKNYDDVPLSKRPAQVMASQKHDGQFAFLRSGIGYSRTGEIYESLLPLAREAYEINPDIVVEIEFMVNGEDGKPLPVNIISGHFRRGEECPQAYGIIHDVIPIKDFDAGYCETVWSERDDWCYELSLISSFIYNEQFTIDGDEASVKDFAQRYTKLGLEGACYKDPDGTWEAGKKDYRVTKVKGFVSYDLECVGVELGRVGTKYEGLFGKLVYKWTDGRTVSARGRISEDEGATYLAVPPIGRIFQVDGMCLTPDGMIREPVTIMERIDKEVADA